MALRAALLALVAGLVACGPPPDRPSFVVALVDTLRADAVGAFRAPGAPGPATPAMDALARESVVFTDASSAAPWTLPSVASLFTSRLVCEHGLVADGDVLPKGLPTLAERLRDAGYATSSWFANPYAGPMSGLDRGFEKVVPIQAADPAALGAWLDGLGGKPFLLYLHTVEPHTPYTALPADASPDLVHRVRLINRLLDSLQKLGRADFAAGRPLGTIDNTVAQQHLMDELAASRDAVVQAYARDVALADARLGAVFDALRQRGLLAKTAVLLLADHGEEFGEHGGWLHDQSLYRELVHVPLVLRLPGAAHAGMRIDEPVSLLDVAPTLLELAGESPLPGGRGRSLLAAIRGEAPPAGPRVVAVRLDRKKFFRPFHQVRGDLDLEVRDGRYEGLAYPERGHLALYDLAADPGETRDISAQEPARVEAMRRVLGPVLKECLAARASAHAAPSLEPEQRRRLEALGYVDGGS